jgi:hypothetical protein
MKRWEVNYYGNITVVENRYGVERLYVNRVNKWVQNGSYSESLYFERGGYIWEHGERAFFHQMFL